MIRVKGCLLDGRVIGVDEALKIKTSARERGLPTPDFRCPHPTCNGPVRPHRSSTKNPNANPAHFEHLAPKNGDCPFTSRHTFGSASGAGSARSARLVEVETKIIDRVIAGAFAGNAGEFFVLAELTRRGWTAALTARNNRAYDILTIDVRII